MNICNKKMKVLQAACDALTLQESPYKTNLFFRMIFFYDFPGI